MDDFRFNLTMTEEIHRAAVNSCGQGLILHNDICLPYFVKLADEEQKRRWLPGIVSGELITAVAMTEPGAGSDLAALKTRAVRVDGGYRVSGSKTFITNGINADLIITAVRTDPKERHRGISLLVIESGMHGFERGRKLEKLGLRAQDTAELFFEDCFVPEQNLLGEEGAGFGYLMSNLAQERLSIAASGIAAARACLDWTLEYVRERRAFDRPIGSFQNTKFVLADLWTRIEVTTPYFDRCVVALNAGELTPEEAAAAKYWCTELQYAVADGCLQLHGGNGYMLEYPIARAFVDARASRIYGGTNEVMREIIGRSLGL
jgi:alkylation response protein AidB-like acyl-CoA dehydrogenase